MGRRQASLGTLVPRTPTVAPGPKARSDLASRRSQRARVKRRGPQPPADLIDAWRLDWSWPSLLPHASSATVPGLSKGNAFVQTLTAFLSFCFRSPFSSDHERPQIC